MNSAAATPLHLLDTEAFGPLGGRVAWVIDVADRHADRAARDVTRAGGIAIGIDRVGGVPPVDPAAFDCLLTAASDPPAPWVGVNHTERAAATLSDAAARAPFAATTLTRVLRVTAALPVLDALAVESLAYSTLLGGAAFRNWRLTHRAGQLPASGERVRISRDGEVVTITLAHPEYRNAIDAPMRDALWEALAAVLDDPTQPDVVLRGDGRCFSTGGALDEFGAASDLAEAHAIRVARSPAALLLELGDRASVQLHGACIGSGIEIPAAAAHRQARAGAFFQLPELTLGLIPGAGGTVTLPRLIGRHRTAWLALSGRKLPAATALRWGLIDAILT